MSQPTDANETKIPEPDEREVSLGRHRAQCSICSHPNCDQIEEQWLDWVSPERTADIFKVSRFAIYRHCRALNLFVKRRKNRMRIYERMAERADVTELSSASVLAAVKIYDTWASRMESAPVQSADPRRLLEKMSLEERERFVRDGSLPEWFGEIPGTESAQGEGEQSEAQTAQTLSVQ
jgi:predicted DNA-binding protein YlxM (UPF0122 family)